MPFVLNPITGQLDLVGNTVIGTDLQETHLTRVRISADSEYIITDSRVVRIMKDDSAFITKITGTHIVGEE
jgi:hypothetical protein